MMTQKEFTVWLHKPWYYTNKRTGAYFKGDNSKNHGFTFMESTNGKFHLWCNFCQKLVGTKFQQHLGGDLHQKRHISLINNNFTCTMVLDNETTKEVFSRLKINATSQLETERDTSNLTGTQLSTAVTSYRVDILEHAYKANLSMRQLMRIKPAIELHNTLGMTIGYVRGLPRTVGKDFSQAQSKKLRLIIEKYYPHFGVITDGSQLGANAAAIIIQLLRQKDHQIINLLVSVRLFDESLSGENIASNILSILTKFDLEPSYRRDTMLDRASVDIKAHKEIL